MRTSLITERVDTSKVSADLMGDWLALYNAQSQPRFYQHPRWIIAIAEHLIPGDVHLCFGRVDETLQCVLPLLSVGASQRLQHPSHDHLSLNDVLIHPDQLQSDQRDTELDALLTQCSNSWWDWRISNAPQDSNIVNAALQNSPGCNIDDNDQEYTTQRWQLRQARTSAWFDLNSEECPPGGKLRRNLRRLRKQLENEGTVRFEAVSQNEKLPQAFEHFLEVESSGWKAQAAIAEDTRLIAFYEAMLRGTSEELTPVINLLWCGDQCAAAQYALRSKNRLSLLKIGYNTDLARFSPGSLLLEHVIEQAKAAQLDTLSLVTSPEWAQRWHPQTMPVWHVTRYNNTPGGKTLAGLETLKHKARVAAKKRRDRAA